MATFRLQGTLPIVPSDLSIFIAQMLSVLGTYGALGPSGIKASIPLGLDVKASLTGTNLVYQLTPGLPNFTSGRLDDASFNYAGIYSLRVNDLNLSAAAFTTAINISTTEAVAFLLSKSDRIFGADANDFISAGKGNDTVFGGDGNDMLLGFIVSPGLDGKDSMFGGAGRDSMAGGTSNDFLSGGKSADTVDGGVGSDRLYGGTGWDTLLGQDGNDRLYGGGSMDTLDGGAGNDRLYGGSGTGYLYGDAGADLLVGGFEMDTLYGGDGKDRIFGGAGSDQLDGGSENDLLVGGAGNDTMYGSNNNDTLRSGTGADYVSGGSGNDRFVFDSALTIGNIDYIADFVVGEDKFMLDKSVFSKISGNGSLSNAQFRIGSEADDASDRIIYDTMGGFLYYDPDGSGGKSAILLATLATGLALGADDFLLIA